MIRSVVIILVLLICVNEGLAQTYHSSDPENHPLLGKRCPEISGTSLKGEPLNLTRGDEAFHVIHFWSLGCGACFKEIPELNLLVKKFASDKVKFISIILESREAVLKKIDVSEPFYQLKREVFRNKDIDFEVITDGKIIYQLFEIGSVNGVPLTLVVDKRGYIRALSNAYYMSYEETSPDKSKNFEILNDMIDKVVAESKH